MDARTFYFTFTLKCKVAINETETNKTLGIFPKVLELSMFRMFKGEEEMFLEQMLAQSLLNVQIEQLRKMLKPIFVPLK